MILFEAETACVVGGHCFYHSVECRPLQTCLKSLNPLRLKHLGSSVVYYVNYNNSGGHQPSVGMVIEVVGGSAGQLQTNTPQEKTLGGVFSHWGLWDTHQWSRLFHQYINSDNSDPPLTDWAYD